MPNAISLFENVPVIDFKLLSLDELANKNESFFENGLFYCTRNDCSEDQLLKDSLPKLQKIYQGAGFTVPLETSSYLPDMTFTQFEMDNIAQVGVNPITVIMRHSGLYAWGNSLRVAGQTIMLLEFIGLHYLCEQLHAKNVLEPIRDEMDAYRKQHAVDQIEYELATNRIFEGIRVERTIHENILEIDYKFGHIRRRFRTDFVFAKNLIGNFNKITSQNNSDGVFCEVHTRD